MDMQSKGAPTNNPTATKRRTAMFRTGIITIFLVLVAAGCNANKDEFHRILSSKLYENKNCSGKYFQITDSGLYVFFGNGKELTLKAAQLVKISENIGRIDQKYGESTLKIDVRIDNGIVYFSPPHLDPPFPAAFWKYMEATGRGTQEDFWSKIDAASPPSLTYPCGE